MVTLHLPPPETKTLLKSLFDFSKNVYFRVWEIFFLEIGGQGRPSTALLLTLFFLMALNSATAGVFNVFNFPSGIHRMNFEYSSWFII